jgi:hypothetical protein
MEQHNEYGKQLMKKIAGPAYTGNKPSTEIDYGAGQPARIDGTICELIAVEVESRVAKQIRGAVLDLICHKYPKKLLVILPVHASNPEIAAEQCRNALARFVSKEDFRVVVTEGSGDNPALEKDAQKVGNALRELGWRQGR